MWIIAVSAKSRSIEIHMTIAMAQNERCNHLSCVVLSVEAQASNRADTLEACNGHLPLKYLLVRCLCKIRAPISIGIFSKSAKKSLLESKQFPG